jgi:probable rRNA maturation factor
VIIHIANTQKDLPIDKGSAKTLVKVLLDYLDVHPEEISLYFVSEKKITSLHEEFFQDPTPTDCISFPLDEQHLGEVFVCPKTAVQYAKKKGFDPFDETALYIVHGILHLLGFDDLEPKAKRTMRKKEKSCMAHLKSLKITLKKK